MRRRSSRGQTLVFVTLSIPVVFGLLGLVVDLGWMYWRREACVTAAQSAAMAAAVAASKAASSFPVSSCSKTTTVWCSATATACSSTITAPPTNNYQTACLYAKANGFVAGGKQNVTVKANNGSTTLVPNVSPSYYITVSVAEKIPITFLAALGHGTFGWATANATAGIMGSADGACLYILDPSGKDSLNASNNAHIRPSCGVYVNSTNSEAVVATGSASVITSGTPQPPIKVVGGVNTNNGGSLSPTVTKTTTGVADPLSGLDVPWTPCTTGTCPTVTCQYTGCAGAANHCDHTNFTVSANSWSAPYVHLTPGTYCGTGGNPAILINNGNSAIFDAGMFVLNGGGLSIQSGTGNSGSNVIFYLTGTNSTYGGVNFANGTQVNFTAPSTGDLADILIYEDRTLTGPTGSSATSTFQGGANSTLDGIIYLPQTTANFANGTTTSNRTSLVVKDAIFAGGTYVFTTDPAGTLRGTGASAPFLIGSN
ncbi:MAG TPA: pilus assembly protein TadG-related protein [Candidatus Sulfopaludibacter sp.]|nr:pilus assembly protein TadG-related protein [Candidatus Sulfopaludibacter sp.]